METFGLQLQQDFIHAGYQTNSVTTLSTYQSAFIQAVNLKSQPATVLMLDLA